MSLNAQSSNKLDDSFFHIENIHELSDKRFPLPKTIKFKGTMLSARLDGDSLFILSYEENMITSASRMINNFVLSQVKLIDGEWKTIHSTRFSFMDYLRHNQIAKISHEKNIVTISFYRESTLFQEKVESGATLTSHDPIKKRKKMSAKEISKLPVEVYEFLPNSSLKVNGEGPYNLNKIKKNREEFKKYEKLFSPQAPPK